MATESLQSNPPTTQKSFEVLIVDDDDVIREGLVGYLENYHEADYLMTVDASPHPADAREKLKQKTYDLVITDINMPGEDGFSLTQYIHETYPQTRSALITAYKVHDYIRTAKQTGIFNIIAKTAPFNFDELSNVVNNLLIPESALGLDTYMEPGARINDCPVTSSDEIMVAFNQLMTFLTDLKRPNMNDLLTAVIEATTNAVYHVAKLPDGSLKYEKGQHIEKLADDETVHVYYGRDGDKLGIAIVDQGGRITADEILYWLDRNISGSGLMDTHGRGVYLMHTLVDRLIINIAPGNRTEIILLDYFGSDYSANKPIYINLL